MGCFWIKYDAGHGCIYKTSDQRNCDCGDVRRGLIYGGFVNGKHYVSYGQDDAEELQDVGAPVILIVENGQCRIATDDERNYFYRFLVKDYGWLFYMCI